MIDVGSLEMRQEKKGCESERGKKRTSEKRSGRRVVFCLARSFSPGSLFPQSKKKSHVKVVKHISELQATDSAQKRRREEEKIVKRRKGLELVKAQTSEFQHTSNR